MLYTCIVRLFYENNSILLNYSYVKNQNELKSLSNLCSFIYVLL